jgi:protein ImuA
MAAGNALHSAKTALLDRLRDQIRLREGRDRPQDGSGGPRGLPTGLGPLDDALPGGGLPAGSLSEWVSIGEGGGAWTLALMAAARLRSGGKVVVLFDDRRRVYPPALTALLPLDALILIRPGDPVRSGWALGQCLACPAVAAVVAAPARMDERLARRLQQAAEAGGGVGLLLRPATAPYRLSAAAVRLAVEPLPSPAGHVRPFQITVERARGLSSPRVLQLEVQLETGHVSASAGPADAGLGRRPQRAS